ncbi:putative Zn(2)-C6 fungal-type domain-containing protein [Seiridium cardinale]
MEQPRQRLACDRCHELKLRCPRVSNTSRSSGAQCARCLKIGSLCVFSASARLGRPLGSSQKSGSSDPGAGDRPKSRHMSISGRLANSSRSTNTVNNSNNRTREPSVLMDDFLSGLFPLDTEGEPESGNNTSFLSGGSQEPGCTYPSLSPGMLQLGFDSQDNIQRGSDVSPGLERQSQDTLEDGNYSANTSDPCVEFATATIHTIALDGEEGTIRAVLSRLSSMVVENHSHSMKVEGQLRVLLLRTSRRHSVVENTSAWPTELQEIRPASDHFGTQALMRTTQSFRDIVRRIKGTRRDNESARPSLISNLPQDGSDVATDSNAFGAVNMRYSLTPESTSPQHCGTAKNSSRTSQYDGSLSTGIQPPPGSPSSCQLALSLMLNCYLEILDIFTTTLEIIRTTVDHYPLLLPLNVGILDFSQGPGSMLDASFSIFTATQLTHRLFEMTKKDMREMWDRYKTHIISMNGDGDTDNRDSPTPRRTRIGIPNSIIQMTFRLSWEKESTIMRQIYDVDDQLNRLMEIS